MRRGEILMADFGPVLGPEQAGTRPAIVMLDDSLGQVFSTTLVVSPTTNLRRLTLPTTLLLKAGEGGLPQDSVVLSYQVQARGKGRRLSRLGVLTQAGLNEVQNAVLTALGV